MPISCLNLNIFKLCKRAGVIKRTSAHFFSQFDGRRAANLHHSQLIELVERSDFNISCLNYLFMTIIELLL